jgi:hypothetical protein
MKMKIEMGGRVKKRGRMGIPTLGGDFVAPGKIPNTKP